MTKLLNEAFDEAAKLSALEQNLIAQWLLNELASEKKWDKSFADSEDILGALADEALEEHRMGKTETLEPEKL